MLRKRGDVEGRRSRSYERGTRKDERRSIDNEKRRKGDCPFWLQDKCLYSDEECKKGVHDYARRGIKLRRPRQDDSRQ